MTRHARSPSTQRQTVSAITRSAPTEHPDSVAPGAGMGSVTARTCQPTPRPKSSREGPVAQARFTRREDASRPSGDPTKTKRGRLHPNGEPAHPKRERLRPSGKRAHTSCERDRPNVNPTKTKRGRLHPNRDPAHPKRERLHPNGEPHHPKRRGARPNGVDHPSSTSRAPPRSRARARSSSLGVLLASPAP